MAEPWQLQLYRRSLKKKQTVNALMGRLPSPQGKLCLEVGCGTGLTSHFLRQRGGTAVGVHHEQVPGVGADIEHAHTHDSTVRGDRLRQPGFHTALG